ncbi:ferroxidase fet3 [Phlyctochytrium planicorne]|nr:ferroxidase fet3 [Phlyctochytrium planicorne]
MKTSLASLLLLAAAASAKVVTYNWNITYVNVNPDGLKERRAIGVNNKWPVEGIEVNYNDTLVINVINQIDYGTSLHSHGLFQNGTVQYDGPSMVTQCPIPPGGKFTYTIPIQQWGTYWIHGHNRGQYVDGLRAPLIIHGPKEPIAPHKYDKEYTITLTDWYHEEHHPLLGQFLSEFNPTGAEPVPKQGLINESKDVVLAFEPGKTYRLRVISMSAFAMFKFYIDGHEMQVIEVDGVETEPSPAESLMVAAAQRYSVLVTARGAGNGTDVNYNIHANMDEDMFDAIPDDLDSKVTGLITYAKDGKPAAETFSTDVVPETSAEDMSLIPLVPIPAFKVDRQVKLTVNFLVLDDGINHGTFNNIPYIKPQVPTLLSTLTVGKEFAAEPAVYGANVLPYILKHMEGVEIVVDNTDAGAHPFHLHGHVFQIVEVNGDHAYDPSNVTVAEFPMRRDTIVIPGGGYAILRFQADNAGVWLFHCHIEWHLESGLVLTFIEAPDVLISKIPTIDPVFAQQCAAQGIPASGNALGKQGLDLGGYPLGPQEIPTYMTGKAWAGFAGAALSAVIGIATVVWYARPDEDEKKRRAAAANGGAADGKDVLIQSLESQCEICHACWACTLHATEVKEKHSQEFCQTARMAGEMELFNRKYCETHREAFQHSPHYIFKDLPSFKSLGENIAWEDYFKYREDPHALFQADPRFRFAATTSLSLPMTCYWAMEKLGIREPDFKKHHRPWRGGPRNASKSALGGTDAHIPFDAPSQDHLCGPRSPHVEQMAPNRKTQQRNPYILCGIQQRVRSGRDGSVAANAEADPKAICLTSYNKDETRNDSAVLEQFAHEVRSSKFMEGVVNSSHWPTHKESCTVLKDFTKLISETALESMVPGFLVPSRPYDGGIATPRRTHRDRIAQSFLKIKAINQLLQHKPKEIHTNVRNSINYEAFCSVCYITRHDIDRLQNQPGASQIPRLDVHCDVCSSLWSCTHHVDQSKSQHTKDLCRTYALAVQMDAFTNSQIQSTGHRFKYLPSPTFKNLTAFLSLGASATWEDYFKHRQKPPQQYLTDPRYHTASTYHLTQPLTTHHALQLLSINPSDLPNNELSITILGAGTFEIPATPLWEDLLHLHPTISHLKLTFVGPDNPHETPWTSIDPCHLCQSRSRTISHRLSQLTYHFFHVLNPDPPTLFVAFNSGCGQADVESWKPTLRLIRTMRRPVCFTTYNGVEAESDPEVVKGLGFEVLGPFENPFRCLEPFVDMVDVEPFYYINRYVFLAR